MTDIMTVKNYTNGRWVDAGGGQRLDVANPATGELRPVLVGTGCAPIEACFRLLQRSGWDGWVCIEEASFQGKAGVEQATRFVRQAWARVAATVSMRRG